MAKSEEPVSVYELYQVEENGKRIKIAENASSNYLEGRIRHLKRLEGNQSLRFDIEKRSKRGAKK